MDGKRERESRAGGGEGKRKASGSGTSTTSGPGARPMDLPSRRDSRGNITLHARVLGFIMSPPISTQVSPCIPPRSMTIPHCYFTRWPWNLAACRKKESACPACPERLLFFLSRTLSIISYFWYSLLASFYIFRSIAGWITFYPSTCMYGCGCPGPGDNTYILRSLYLTIRGGISQI